MKTLITLGIFFLTLFTINAQQKIDNSIFQILKSQSILHSNKQTKLIGENKNEKIYEIIFTKDEYGTYDGNDYADATLIVYDVDSFEFIYDTTMGKNHTKTIVSKRYSVISKTIISTSAIYDGSMSITFEQYYNNRKIFEKNY